MASLHDEKTLRWLDRAYAPAKSLASWLDAVTTGLAELAPGAVGSVGRIVRSERGGRSSLVCPYAIAVERGAVERTLVSHARNSQHRVDVVEGGSGLRDMRRRSIDLAIGDRYLQNMVATFDRIGVSNLHHLTASDGAGCVVSVGLMTTLPKRVGIPRMLWAVLSAHLESAFRLQMAIDDRMRAMLRRDTDRDPALDARRAREVWAGVVAGAWSVVSRWDRGDEFRVVAIPATSADARGLTQREAQIAALSLQGYSDKAIAFSLGIARSTVSGYLYDAVWKLGFRSRVEWMSALCARSHGDARHADIVPRGSLRARSLPGGAVRLDVSTSTSNALLAKLTPAQQRVVRLALENRSDREIALELGRSHHTVSNLLRGAYRQLDVSGRLELAAVLGR